MRAEGLTEKNRPCAIEPYDKEWGVGVSGLDEDISPFPRINRMRQKTRDAHRTADVQRLNIVTEGYKKYNNLPQEKKVACVFRDILKNVDVHIDEDELLVGELAAPAWAAALYPEFSINWVKEEIEASRRGELPWFDQRKNDKYYIPDEVIDQILKAAEFWEGKSIDSAILAECTEEEHKGGCCGGKGVYSEQLYTYNGVGHVCANYEKLFKGGFGAIEKRVREKRAEIQLGDPEGRKKQVFYDAVLTVLEGVYIYFNKYAALAKKMAETAEPVRQKELLRIASNCEWLGAGNAPRDFWEAMQLMVMATNLIMVESNGHSITWGRFDVLYYPFYKRDIENGTLTREQMQELIECMFIKMDHHCKIRDYGSSLMASGVNFGGEALLVGGVDARGNDITNDLSYMVLDAHAHTRIPNPWMGVRLSSKTPYEFKVKVFNVIRIGTGEPKIYNDEQMIQALMNYGKPIEDARNYVGIGCVEPSIPGKSYGWCDSAYFDMAKIIELTVNDGYELTAKEGDGRLGLATGKFTEMKSFDEFKDAFSRQMKYWVDRCLFMINVQDMVHQRLKPLPYLSLIMDDCVERGIDVTAGGAIYNHAGPQGVGLGTCADSLATIKQLVFEEKMITAEELLTALKDNWKGHEKLQAYVNSDRVHHYGNDDDYADELTQFVIDCYCKNVEHRPTAHGGEFMPGVYSVSINVALGTSCNATPDGRVNGEPVSDCLGPVHTVSGGSHDVRGPIAMANSIAKLDQARIGNGVILNWKFTPSTLTGEIGKENLINLMGTYFEKGGMQSQFNVTSKETLLAARKNPEKYKNLMVRVAGYSAYFTELSEELQNDLIGRTELSFD